MWLAMVKCGIFLSFFKKYPPSNIQNIQHSVNLSLKTIFCSIYQYAAPTNLLFWSHFHSQVASGCFFFVEKGGFLRNCAGHSPPSLAERREDWEKGGKIAQEEEQGGSSDVKRSTPRKKNHHHQKPLTSKNRKVALLSQFYLPKCCRAGLSPESDGKNCKKMTNFQSRVILVVLLP